VKLICGRTDFIPGFRVFCCTTTVLACHRPLLHNVTDSYAESLNQYKFFVNDHLVLTHDWVDGPPSVRMQIEARANPIHIAGATSCKFDYFKLWSQR
jgi:hypothetical protein